jgi:hypothetical protein
MNECESKLEGKCRRRHRGKSPQEAVECQLHRVAEGLSLDAIVLADDLGRILVRAGNPVLAGLLAGSAMWSATGIDALTVDQVRHRYPQIDVDDMVSEPVFVPGADGARLIAAGKTIGLHAAVDHAITGIMRICTTWVSSEDQAETVDASTWSAQPAV